MCHQVLARSTVEQVHTSANALRDVLDGRDGRHIVLLVREGLDLTLDVSRRLEVAAMPAGIGNGSVFWA